MAASNYVRDLANKYSFDLIDFNYYLQFQIFRLVYNLLLKLFYSKPLIGTPMTLTPYFNRNQILAPDVIYDEISSKEM